MSRRRRTRGRGGDGDRREPEVHRVPGPRAVTELLRHAPGRVRHLWVDRRRDGDPLVTLAEQAGIEVQWLEGRQLAQRAPALDCQGVLAEARPPAWVDLDDLIDRVLELPEDGPERRMLVALDGVQDPQNLGAIMRTSEFFGVAGLVWPRDRAATVTPAVVRASAGASERLPLCRVVNLARALERGQERGLWVMGTVAEGGESLPTLRAEDRIPMPLMLVMGGEHGGLRRLTRARCDLLVTIPGRGGVASLNVSAATAAALASLH